MIEFGNCDAYFDMDEIIGVMFEYGKEFDATGLVVKIGRGSPKAVMLVFRNGGQTTIASPEIAQQFKEYYEHYAKATQLFADTTT